MKFLRFCANFKLKIVGQVKIVIGVDAWEIAVMEMLGESESLLEGMKLDGSIARMMVSEGDVAAIPDMLVLGAVVSNEGNQDHVRSLWHSEVTGANMLSDARGAS